MALGLDHLKITNDTTIQQSILENQEAAGPTNIIGTINKIIDVAGTGGGEGNYVGSDSIYIVKSVGVADTFYVASHWMNSSTAYPTYLQAINTKLTALTSVDWPPQPGSYPTNACMLDIDYSWGNWYQVSSSIDLFNLEHDFNGSYYKYFWNESEDHQDPGKIVFYAVGDQFGKNFGKDDSEWAYGVLTWVGRYPINFYNYLYLYTSNTQNFKINYKVSNEPQEINYSDLYVTPMFKSNLDNKYKNEKAMYTGQYKSTDWVILKDESEIIWNKPGIYPLYIWPMFSPNKTIINIEIKE